MLTVRFCLPGRLLSSGCLVIQTSGSWSIFHCFLAHIYFDNHGIYWNSPTPVVDVTLASEGDRVLLWLPGTS